MSRHPGWKVFVDGRYVASCHDPVYAAMILAGAGGGDIRYRGYGKKDVVFADPDGSIAAESYDEVVDACRSNLAALIRAADDRREIRRRGADMRRLNSKGF